MVGPTAEVVKLLSIPQWVTSSQLPKGLPQVRGFVLIRLLQCFRVVVSVWDLDMEKRNGLSLVALGWVMGMIPSLLSDLVKSNTHHTSPLGLRFVSVSARLERFQDVYRCINAI